jgi:Uma2 family endonuclease
MSTGPASAEDTALLLESPRRLTVEEYHRMIEAGILAEDEHVELLEGVIVAMSPQSEPHAYCIQWLNRLLIERLPKEYTVRPQMPLALGKRNEPEPDLAVVRTDAGSRNRRPTTALLVIEVSLDSLRRDRRVKAAVYARAAIPEYWIVDVAAEAIEVFTEPDTASGAYRRTQTITKTETLTSEALPQISFPVAELFG